MCPYVCLCVIIYKIIYHNDIKANIEAMNRFGQTPLHHASMNGKIESLKFLLENGANIEAMDKSGKTPLHYAIIFAQIESLKFLLENGANIEAMDKSDQTALDMATSSENTPFINILKNHKPKPVDCTSQENENKLLVEQVSVFTQLFNDASMALSKCDDDKKNQESDLSEMSVKMMLIEQQLNDKNNAIDILSSSIDLLKSDILGKASTISTLEESVNSLKMENDILKIDLQSCLTEREEPVPDRVPAPIPSGWACEKPYAKSEESQVVRARSCSVSTGDGPYDGIRKGINGIGGRYIGRQPCVEKCYKD